MKTVLKMEVRGRQGREALVLLHGFMGRGLAFAPIIGSLAKKFQVIAPDLPGHGDSLFENMESGRNVRKMEHVAGLVLDDLGKLGVERFSLYGYSMGGRLAQAVSLAQPQRVRRLCLESAGFGLDDPRERRARYSNDLALLDGVETREQFQAFLEKWHNMPLFQTLRGTSLKQDLIRAKKDCRVRELKKALAVMSVGNHVCFLPGLAKAPFPIHYFYGSLDEKYRLEAMRARTQLPDASFTAFPNASHNIHAQFPGQIAGAICKAMKENGEE